MKANEVWSWDISYLPTTVIGQHYYLYMIEDIYSRKIVGWEVHTSESGEQAAELLERSVWAEKCRKKELVLHSDNLSSSQGSQYQVLHAFGLA
jgi:transposase InsO family protein